MNQNSAFKHIKCKHVSGSGILQVGQDFITPSYQPKVENHRLSELYYFHKALCSCPNLKTSEVNHQHLRESIPLNM